jgi:hypothetical protein
MGGAGRKLVEDPGAQILFTDLNKFDARSHGGLHEAKDG